MDDDPVHDGILRDKGDDFHLEPALILSQEPVEMIGPCAPNDLDGVDYAIKTLMPKAYLASDGESTEFVLSEVSAFLAKYRNQTKIFCPEHLGDMFILKTAPR